MLVNWAGDRLGVADFRPCTAIGVVHRDEIVAAAIYNNYRPPNIDITFVTPSPRWASAGAHCETTSIRSRPAFLAA
jgi:hypothetical protein